jgi:hypothetical protein
MNKAAPIGLVTLMHFHFEVAVFYMIVYIVIFVNRWPVKGL